MSGLHLQPRAYRSELIFLSVVAHSMPSLHADPRPRHTREGSFLIMDGSANGSLAAATMAILHKDSKLALTGPPLCRAAACLPVKCSLEILAAVLVEMGRTCLSMRLDASSIQLVLPDHRRIKFLRHCHCNAVMSGTGAAVEVAIADADAVHRGKAVGLRCADRRSTGPFRWWHTASLRRQRAGTRPSCARSTAGRNARGC